MLQPEVESKRCNQSSIYHRRQQQQSIKWHEKWAKNLRQPNQQQQQQTYRKNAFVPKIGVQPISKMQRKRVGNIYMKIKKKSLRKTTFAVC